MYVKYSYLKLVGIQKCIVRSQNWWVLLKFVVTQNIVGTQKLWVPISVGIQKLGTQNLWAQKMCGYSKICKYSKMCWYSNLWALKLLWVHKICG